MGRKLAVIGGGSTYTPELIEGLIARADTVPITEIALHDIDESRLSIITGMTRRMFDHFRVRIEVAATTDRRAALEDADFVITQIRVGGNQARVLDERIPLKHGLLGQETTGAGGFAKALRTVPVMLDIARDIERIAPHAWLFNLTNPAGLVTEAIVRHSHVRTLGICSGYTYVLNAAAAALDVPMSSLRMDYVGLNHLTWGYRFESAGEDVTSAVLERLPASVNGIDRRVVQALGMIPMPYLAYFYHHDRIVAQQRERRRTRAEDVLEMETELLLQYANEPLCEVPEMLRRRGNGEKPRNVGYADVALDVMRSILDNDGATHIVNTPNGKAVEGFDKDTVLEMPANVYRDRIVPAGPRQLPMPIRGLVHAVKAYEQLTIEAAIGGNRNTALQALIAHPLIGDTDVAHALLDDLLDAHATHLPRFFPSPCRPNTAALVELASADELLTARVELV